MLAQARGPEEEKLNHSLVNSILLELVRRASSSFKKQRQGFFEGCGSSLVTGK